MFYLVVFHHKWGANSRSMRILWLDLGPLAYLIHRPLALITTGIDCILHEVLCWTMLNPFLKIFDTFKIHPRMGIGDKFDNPLTKQLHDIGALVTKKVKVSLHENVTTFQEDQYLRDVTGCEIQKAELLDFTSKVLDIFFMTLSVLLSPKRFPVSNHNPLSHQAITTMLRRAFKQRSTVEVGVQPQKGLLELCLFIWRTCDHPTPTTSYTFDHGAIRVSFCYPQRGSCSFAIGGATFSVRNSSLAEIFRKVPWEEMVWFGFQPRPSVPNRNGGWGLNDFDDQHPHLVIWLHTNVNQLVQTHSFMITQFFWNSWISTLSCKDIFDPMRSRRHQRLVTGKEMLATLGYPSRPQTANQLQTVTWLSLIF